MNKREQQRIATLEKIRATVDSLVHEVGFEKMTIRQICQHANMTTGAFYHHFKSKNELLYDRYYRACVLFTKLDNEELDALAPLQAIKRLYHFSAEFAVSRIPQISLPYHRALLTEYKSWEKQYEDTYRAVALKHFRRGREMGLLMGQYTAEELCNMFWCLHIGARYALLLEGGAFCADNRIDNQVLDWLDSLAKP